MKTRIYLVTENSVDSTAYHLVRAKSQAQAMNHVVTPRFTVEPASVDQVASLLTDGLKVEDATAPEDVAQLELIESADSDDQA